MFICGNGRKYGGRISSRDIGKNGILYKKRSWWVSYGYHNRTADSIKLGDDEGAGPVLSCG